MLGTLANSETSLYADRLQRAQQEMARQGIDLLVVGVSADVQYLIGYAGYPLERMSVLVLPREGTPHYVLPGFEAPLLEEQRSLVEIVTWNHPEDPATKVSAIAGRAAQGTIAANDELWSVFLLSLQEAMPGTRWTGAGSVLWPLRMIKDEFEIDLIADAARRTDAAWEEFLTTSIAGLTEAAVRERVETLLKAHGLPAVLALVGSGPNGASPHHYGGDRVVREGDAVVCDFGGILEPGPFPGIGYGSDVTRTVHVGEPSPEFVRAYEAVLAANQAAFEAVRPGVPCQEIDRAARRVLTDAGYGEAFIHGLGHGIGLSGHEEPYLREGNTLPLAEGMVFSDEPGVYFPGEFGVRIEDIVVCTADGGRRLNEAPRELRVIG